MNKKPRQTKHDRKVVERAVAILKADHARLVLKYGARTAALIESGAAVEYEYKKEDLFT